MKRRAKVSRENRKTGFFFIVWGVLQLAVGAVLLWYLDPTWDGEMGWGEWLAGMVMFLGIGLICCGISYVCTGLPADFMATISYYCPKCGAKIDSPAQEGAVSTCPRCRTRLLTSPYQGE